MNAPTPPGITAPVKTRPILFSAPMVTALLAGRKTQTRRLAKAAVDRNFGCAMAPCEIAAEVNNRDFTNCPYGAPGDLLWVRETWQEFFADEVPVWRRDAPAGRMGIPAQPDRKSVVAYRADGEISPHPEYGHAVWRPSIHMPRWASRLTLRITDVRVERVQDISERDAIEEGVWGTFIEDGRYWRNYSLSDEDAACSPMLNFPSESYRTLWESINGAGSWDANPWVWALTFEVLRGNIAQWAPA